VTLAHEYPAPAAQLRPAAPVASASRDYPDQGGYGDPQPREYLAVAFGFAGTAMFAMATLGASLDDIIRVMAISMVVSPLAVWSIVYMPGGVRGLFARN
jgi:hypothetical protein